MYFGWEIDWDTCWVGTLPFAGFKGSSTSKVRSRTKLYCCSSDQSGCLRLWPVGLCLHYLAGHEQFIDICLISLLEFSTGWSIKCLTLAYTKPKSFRPWMFKLFPLLYAWRFYFSGDTSPCLPCLACYLNLSKATVLVLCHKVSLSLSETWWPMCCWRCSGWSPHASNKTCSFYRGTSPVYTSYESFTDLNPLILGLGANPLELVLISKLIFNLPPPTASAWERDTPWDSVKVKWECHSYGGAHGKLSNHKKSLGSYVTTTKLLKVQLFL